MYFAALNLRELGYIPEDARPKVCEDTRGIVAWSDDHIPQAIAVFDSWSFSSCLIHIWIQNPFVLKHGFAEECFKFVFDNGYSKIIGNTPSNNIKALKFIKHIGFKELYRIKDGFDLGVDYVLTEMNKDECRYYGREKDTQSP